MALRALQGPTGGGAPVGGGGTSSPSTIPRWTGPSTLGDSGLVDNGTAIYTTTRNVGIGTANPGAQLQVERAGGLSNAEYLRFRNTTSGSGSAVAQDYYVHANTVATGRIQHTWNGTTYDTTLSVWNNSLSSLQEAVRVQGGGNVGIGTSTMVAPGLTITDPTNANNIARLNLRNTNSDGGNRIATVGYNGNAIQLFTASETTGTANNLLAQFQYNNAIFYTGTTATNPQERARIDSNGNIYGTSGTTGMTNGFFYIPAAAGAPTGVPTAVAGRVPMYYDTTNNQFYVYNGGWKKVTLA